MKTGLLGCTATLNLPLLSWNSFSQVATASYVKFKANFTPAYIQVVSAISGGSLYVQLYYRFFVATGGAILPAWVIPGAGVNITASVTINGISYDVSGSYIVRDVDTDAGAYFDVTPVVPGGGNTAIFTMTINKTALDSGSGLQATPLVSLVMQAQKVMIGASSGAVIVAPVVDFNGGAPNSETITNGQGEYEFTAPNDMKFDLADWSVKWSAAGTMYVRFI